MNISESNDVVQLLEFLTGERTEKAHEVRLAMLRLAERAGKALQVSPQSFLTADQAEGVIIGIREAHAYFWEGDIEGYGAGIRPIEDVPTGGAV